MSTHRRKNTNSAVVAAICLLLCLLSVLWQGWQGGVIFMVAFTAGGVGTVVNARRSGAL